MTVPSSANEYHSGEAFSKLVSMNATGGGGGVGASSAANTGTEMSKEARKSEQSR
jgi:hypothetical protein